MPTTGTCYSSAARTADSLEKLREAVTTLERLNASGWNNSEVRTRLSVTYGYLALVLRLGTPVAGVVPDLKAAVEMQRKAIALDESLATAAPADTALQRQVMIDTMNLGEILGQLGDRGAALDQLRQGLARAEQLARSDAANLQAHSDFAWASYTLGALLAKDGATDEAFVLLGRAARLLEPVVAADAANVNTRSHVASNSEGLGQAHVALASNRSLAHDARLGHWREAKGFQDSYVFWKEMRDKGITTGADAARPEALALEIAKCDAALGAGPTTRERR